MLQLAWLVRSALQTMVKFFAVLMLSVACFCGCRTRAATLGTSGGMPLRVTSEDPNFINALAGLPQFAVETVAIGATNNGFSLSSTDRIDLATAVANLAYLGFTSHLPNQPRDLRWHS